MRARKQRLDLSAFPSTSLYKEIRAQCGLPVSSDPSKDHWSLIRDIQMCENGLTVNSPGSLRPSQKRRLATLFVPNKKESHLKSLNDKILLCKLNKDGSRLVAGCANSMLHMFDASNGTYRDLFFILGRGNGILDIDFSPCGKYFVYTARTESAIFMVPMDTNAGRLDLEVINLYSEDLPLSIFSIRFSPCGRSLLCGCNDGQTYIYDLETHSVETFKTYLYHYGGSINAISYLSDSDLNVFTSGTNTSVIRLWDKRCLNNSLNSNDSHHPKPVSSFIGHMGGITYIDPRNDGNHFLSNSNDGSIKIWDVRRPTPSMQLVSLYMHTSLTTLIESDASIMTYRGHSMARTLSRAKFSPAVQTGQRYIYTGCSSGFILIYDVLTGRVKAPINSHNDIVRDLSWHPVRNEIVSGSWDKDINLNTYRCNPLLRTRVKPPFCKRPLQRPRHTALRSVDVEGDESEGATA